MPPTSPRRAAPRLAAVVTVIAAIAVAGVVMAATARAGARQSRAPATAAAAARPAPLATAPLRSPAASPRAPAPGARLASALQPSQPGCGFFDIACHVSSAITGWFKNLVISAINPVFGLLGKSLLATPQLDQTSEVQRLWTGSLVVANACIVLLVVAGGLILMGYQTVQTSYTVKDIAPRMVVAVVLANMSLLLAGKAIGFANGLSSALLAPGVNPSQAAKTLSAGIAHAIDPSNAVMFVILVAIAAVVLGLILALIYVVRIMLTILLIGAAPLALVCHALPQTEGLAKLWWRAFTGVLAVQVAQALVFIAAMRVFFSPNTANAFGLGGPDSSLSLWITVCLLYVLVRIPFWISRMIWRGGVHHSPITRAVRFVVAAAVLSRAGFALRGGTSRRAFARSGGRPPGSRPGPRRPPPRPSGGGSSGSGGPGAGGAGPRRPPPGAHPPAGGPGAKLAGPGQARRPSGSASTPAASARPGGGAPGQRRRPPATVNPSGPGAGGSTPSTATAGTGRVPPRPGTSRRAGSGPLPGVAGSSPGRRSPQPPVQPGPRPRAGRSRQPAVPVEPPPARQPRQARSARQPGSATPRGGDRR